MELATYTASIILRLAYTPIFLIVCLVKYLYAVQQEKIVGVVIYDRENDDSTGGSDHPGAAGVDDTLAAIRAKAGSFGKVQRLGDFNQ